MITAPPSDVDFIDLNEQLIKQIALFEIILSEIS